VLPAGESFVDGATARWVEIRELAIRAEEIGFDTVWIPDELLWRPPDGQVRGWWECVALTGAVAAATSRVKVGTWILSALHRNPGLTAKAVETLDEIGGGRFVFGLGSGHAGRQAHASDYPRTTCTAVSKRRSRSSFRSFGTAARRSRGPSTRVAIWSTDQSDRAPAGSRS
jgi:alkanesulfonate monooxygenase SsuD/methylene tetrahydromethanopterin reductase-like flavin-dependent oxidoreductase (luciferase family)